MPRITCCVPGCCKRGGYHFPLNTEMKKDWLAAIQRPNWVPKINTPVCSDHFVPEDFVHEGGVPTDKLKRSVIPSVFWWSGSNSENRMEVESKGMKKGTTPTKKSVDTVGSVTNPTVLKLSTQLVPDLTASNNTDNTSTGNMQDVDEYDYGDEDEDDDEDDEDAEDEFEDDEDDFEDAGAIMDDSDEEYKGDEDDLEDDEDYDYNLEDDYQDNKIIVNNRSKKAVKSGTSKIKKSSTKCIKSPGLLKTGSSKKRKIDDLEDNVLSENKRSNTQPSLPEYSRQLNKAYKEISRLSTRCQVLDAAIKNKAQVTHRSRTIYQIGKYVLPHQLSFIESQMVNSTLAPGQRRWSRRMRNICLGLHRHSRHAYSFLAKIFALPLETDLVKWGAQSPDSGGPHTEGDVAPNNVSLTEAEALVDEVIFDNLMSVIL